MGETPATTDLSHLEDFRPFVGRVFRIEGAGDLSLVLDAVSPGPPAPPPHRAPFALIFRGPKPGPVLAEGLHACRIDDGPACALYIMPIHTPWPDRQDYQAVFG